MTLDLEAIERTGGYPEDIAPLIAEVRRLRELSARLDTNLNFGKLYEEASQQVAALEAHLREAEAQAVVNEQQMQRTLTDLEEEVRLSAAWKSEALHHNERADRYREALEEIDDVRRVARQALSDLPEQEGEKWSDWETVREALGELSTYGRHASESPLDLPAVAALTRLQADIDPPKSRE